MANLLRERKYLLLAATLGMIFLLQPILNHLETGRFWFEVLRSLIFLAMLLTFHGHWGGSRWGFGFGVATLATQWAAWLTPAFHVEVGFHLLAALFVGFAVAATIRSLPGTHCVPSWPRRDVAEPHRRQRCWCTWGPAARSSGCWCEWNNRQAPEHPRKTIEPEVRKDRYFPHLRGPLRGNCVMFRPPSLR